MFSRVVEIKVDPARTEDGIKGWTEYVLPLLKKQPGFAGATLAGNRETGEGLAVSYWETEKAMADARDQVRPEATTMMASQGGSVGDDHTYEVAVMERIHPAKAGVFVRVTTADGKAELSAEGITAFKDKVLPALSVQHGYRGAFSFVNPQTGRTLAGSWWDTVADLDRSESAINDIRQSIVKKIGGTDATTKAYEIYFTEILAPTAAAV